jgi:hypothetical protein
MYGYRVRYSVVLYLTNLLIGLAHTFYLPIQGTVLISKDPSQSRQQYP